MALIKCPECSREISDKVKSCPHCGFPLDSSEENTQKVELSSVKLKIDKKRKKQIIIAAVSIILIFLVGISINNSLEAKEQERIQQEELSSKEAYIQNVNSLMSSMVSNASEAEELLNLTLKVWYNSIYQKNDEETDKYTMKDGVWNDDFNDSLSSLYIDKLVDSSSLKKELDSNSEKMKELSNPPDDYSNIHDNLLNLYVSYESVINLAIDPSGNYTSFSESKRAKIDQFLSDFNKVKALIPSTVE